MRLEAVLWAVVALAVPYEYSHVVTQPYRCAPCYGAVFVDRVRSCVEAFDCARFEYGLCRVTGVFGVESLSGDFVDSGDNYAIFAGKALPEGYLLRSLALELEEREEEPAERRNGGGGGGVTVSLLSSHTEVVAKYIMLKATIPTSVGEKIAFDSWEAVRPTGYIRLDWNKKKKIRRVVAEYILERSASCPSK